MKSVYVGVGAVLICAVLNASEAYTTISRDTVSKWVEGGASFSYLLIDVRDTAELQSTGIIATDAVRPYHLSLDQGVFAKEYGRIPKNAPVVIYCRSGNRSAQASQILTQQGYTAVYSMSTGMSTWVGSKRDYSFAKPSSQLPAYSFQIASTASYSVRVPATIRWEPKAIRSVQVAKGAQMHGTCNLLGRLGHGERWMGVVLTAQTN